MLMLFKVMFSDGLSMLLSSLMWLDDLVSRKIEAVGYMWVSFCVFREDILIWPTECFTVYERLGSLLPNTTWLMWRNSFRSSSTFLSSCSIPTTSILVRMRLTASLICTLNTISLSYFFLNLSVLFYRSFLKGVNRMAPSSEMWFCLRGQKETLESSSGFTER